MLCSQTSPCRPISTLHISMSFLASAVKIPKKILDSLDQIPWRDVLYFRNVSVSTCTVGIWKYFLSKIIYTIALKRLRKMHFLLFCLLFQPVWISFSTLGRTLTACTVFSKWFFNLEAFHVVQLKKQNNGRYSFGLPNVPIFRDMSRFFVLKSASRKKR